MTNKETEDAIVQIPKELNKMTKILAAIGEALFNVKMKKFENDKEEFKEFMKESKWVL